MSIPFKLLVLLLGALGLAGYAFKAGIDHQEGVQARQDLERVRLETLGRIARRAVITQAAEHHEAAKERIRKTFAPIETEVTHEIQSHPDLYSRECLPPDGLRQLTEAIAATGAGGDRRQPAPAVPASGAAR